MGLAHPARLDMQPGRLAVHGAIGFDSANALCQQGMAWMGQQPAGLIAVDLSGLSESNTLTLAVLVQWARRMRADQHLQLQQVPNHLAAIIRASHLEVLLSEPQAVEPAGQQRTP